MNPFSLVFSIITFYHRSAFRAHSIVFEFMSTQTVAFHKELDSFRWLNFKVNELAMTSLFAFEYEVGIGKIKVVKIT